MIKIMDDSFVVMTLTVMVLWLSTRIEASFYKRRQRMEVGERITAADESRRFFSI